jgi:hypothetical protein
MPIESDWPLQVAKMTRKNGDSTIKSGEEHLKEPIFHRLSKHLLSLCYIYILSDSILRQRANVGSSTRWSKLTQPFQRLACLWWHQPRSLWPRSRWFHSCQSLNSNAIQLMARTPKMTQHRLLTDPITRNSAIVSTKGPALGFVINENVLPSSDLWLADSRLHPEAPMYLPAIFSKGIKNK